MAYGGPDSLDEIPGYLADIRSGRPTPRAILEEITSNYRQIGGKSPLLEITRQQVRGIAERLEPDRFRFYIGMRHWTPWIEDTVGLMIADGITHAISLVLAPHFSKLSIAKYQKKIADGLDMHHGQIRFEHIDSFNTAPGLIRALADRVLQGLNHWPESLRDRVHVVFSAHSLPTRILQMGDPYDSQLRETARLVAQAAGLDPQRWSWSYQSAGRSPEPWLGPQIQDYLPELAQRGIRDVISIPVGFVADHVEILYDIDILAQQVAKRSGIRLERPEALNADPIFLGAVADKISKRAKAVGWIR